jgi:hypothetical protein
MAAPDDHGDSGIYVGPCADPACSPEHSAVELSWLGLLAEDLA